MKYHIFCRKLVKISQTLSSAAVVIGALRVNPVNLQDSSWMHVITIRVENSVDPDQMASSEAILSGSTLFSKRDKFGFSRCFQKKDKFGFSRTRVNLFGYNGLISFHCC